MKSLKMLFTSIAVAAMLAGCSDSQVNSVKKGILEIDKSRSIEQAFSVNMENMEWEKFTSDDNITFVKFVGVWKKAETYSGRFNVFPGDKVMIQFIINADDTFRFSYGEIQDANGITSQYTPHNMMTASIKSLSTNKLILIAPCAILSSHKNNGGKHGNDKAENMGNNG